MNELEIWKGVQQGNYKAFEQLYNLYFKRLYSYGLKICGDAGQVEDAVHDMFLDIWKYHSNLSDTTSISFYLFRTLRRKIFKNQQAESKASVFEHDIKVNLTLEEKGHEQQLVDKETITEKIQKLKNNLVQLPSRQHEALILKFFNGFSYPEIADLLEVNEQSARNLVQRGLEKLRKLLFIILITGIIQLLNL